jgi:mannitol operon repressor
MVEIPPMSEELKRKHPHLEPTFWPYLYTLNAESPRGKVLITSSVLEDLLRGVLQAFMREGTSDALFEGPSAPFGTFSSRILGCHALGLITDDEMSDLTLIRKIKNQFAHELTSSFDTPTVRTRCRELRLKIPDSVKSAIGQDVQRALTDPEVHFTTSAVNLPLRPSNRAYYVAEERRSAKEWT